MPGNPIVTFREWVQRISYPSALRGDVGSRFIQALGLLGDIVAEQTFRATAARNLHSPEYPPDALPLTGNERMLMRFANESAGVYQRRLTSAWTTWLQGGTSGAIVTQFALAGWTAIVREQRNWMPDGSVLPWNWDAGDDGLSANWSRFWLLVTSHPWQRWFWGDGHVYGDGSTTWGSTATTTDVAFMRQIVRKWKPAHVICQYIILVFDSADLEPDGTWDNHAHRDPRAAYIPGSS